MAQGRSTKIVLVIRWIQATRLSIKTFLSMQVEIVWSPSHIDDYYVDRIAVLTRMLC